jgi:hypothetical protein
MTLDRVAHFLPPVGSDLDGCTAQWRRRALTLQAVVSAVKRFLPAGRARDRAALGYHAILAQSGALSFRRRADLSKEAW